MFYTLSLIILGLVFYFWTKASKLPPGPWGLPYFGYLFWLDKKSPYKTLTNLSKKYGKIYSLSLGRVPTVVLTDPKTIKQVFSKEASTGRAPLYLTHGIMQGYGVICAEGELWKDQRRFVYNCLRQLGGLKISPQKPQMEALILKNAVDFVKHVKVSGQDVKLNPLNDLRHSLGSVMNTLVFGRTWDRDDKTWLWLQHLQEEGTKHIGVAGPLNFIPSIRFVSKYKQTMKFLLEGKHKTHKIYHEIITEELSKLTEDHQPTNFIQAFLIEREKRVGTPSIEQFYNDEQFHHMLADIFGAGLDTTLTTLRWYLLFLATNPDIQQKIRQEIKQILQNKSPTLELISFMPLFNASVAETQRIRSVVPVGIPHGAVEDLIIDGYEVPKGTMIVPLQWAIHMDEIVWKEPNKFDPMRFINEEGQFVKHDNFMPFQLGKRMCVGDELARMMLLLFGATILQEFSLHVDDISSVDLDGECGITLTPTHHDIIFKSSV